MMPMAIATSTSLAAPNLENLKQIRHDLDVATEVLRLADKIKESVDRKEKLIDEQKFAEAADERDNEKDYRQQLTRILGITVN